MDSVEFEGITYERAAVIAKRFGYTQDYVGQLCRGKKVDARLVGRSWFVNPDSISTHIDKKKERQATLSTKPSSKSADSSKSPSVGLEVTEDSLPAQTTVPPVPTRTTLKFAANPHPVGSVTIEPRKLTVAYEPDEEDLIPTLHRKHTPPPTPLSVTPAGAKQVNIKSSTRGGATLSPEPLPDVALSGVIKVAELPLEPVVVTEPSDTSATLSEQHTPSSEPAPVRQNPTGHISLTRETVEKQRKIKIKKLALKKHRTHIKDDAGQKVAKDKNKQQDNQGVAIKQGELKTQKTDTTKAQLTKVQLKSKRPNSSAVDSSLSKSQKITQSNKQDLEYSSQNKQIHPDSFVPQSVRQTGQPQSPVAFPVLAPALLLVIALLGAFAILTAGSAIDVSSAGLEAGVFFRAFDIWFF